MYTRVLNSKLSKVLLTASLFAGSAAALAHSGPAHVHSDSMILSAAALGIAGILAVIAVAKFKASGEKAVKGEPRNDA